MSLERQDLGGDVGSRDREMKKPIVFDPDGTLAASKSPREVEMARLPGDWLETRRLVETAIGRLT